MMGDGGQGDVGNTPTGVGKTLPFLQLESSRRKHPHGRGEDKTAVRLD